MKKILPLLWMLATLTQALSADPDWRKAAREFMVEQEIAPIEIKPGARFETDFARDRWAWMQRVFLPPFEKHLAQWPTQVDAARSFVKQALMAHAGHPDVDPRRSWEVLSKEGEALVKAGVDDPLVLWLAARAVWNFREGFGEARGFVSKARRHPTIQDYPQMLVVYLNDVIYDSQWPKTSEITAKARLERYTEIIKSAADSSVFGPQDDEVLLDELDFIFTSIHDRAEELEQLCVTPHFTPWLREMLLGKLQNQIAWNLRGGNYPYMKEEDRQKFDEHQIKARTHFLKAWELHPDRAAAAAAMIDIVKGGNGRQGETARQWFDRALAAQFDCYPAYHNYLWTLRPQWGGSLDKMKAFYCACALTNRDDTVLTEAMRLALKYLALDSSDIRKVLSQTPMKEAAIEACRNLVESKNVYRAWEHPWRLSDLGMIAWAAGDYETADDILQQVPVPFPRETRRSYHLHLSISDNEANVRAQSRLFALGLDKEWEAAEDLYQSKKVADALQSYQDLTARFQGEPPVLLLERISACKFEKSFATGGWVPVWADPDLAAWHRRSGSWTGLKSGTLVNNGQDAQAYIVHNGRVGSNFELMGEYEVKNGSRFQGLDIMLGYHIREEDDHWISCMQWQIYNSIPIGSVRSVYTWPEPRITPPVNGKVWNFHIYCRNGAVTYRINHRDIVVDYRPEYMPGSLFEMPEDSQFGVSSRFFSANSHTHVRRLKVRRLDPPAEIDQGKETPANLSALRTGFQAACRSSIASLNATTQTEAEVQADELKRVHKDAEAGKMRAFISQLKTTAGVKFDDMPVPAPGEETLATLLRGYMASLNARLTTARAQWKTKALALHAATQNPQEASDVMLYVGAELGEAPGNVTEDPLASSNRLKWQPQYGDWTRTTEVLTGGVDSIMYYECNRKSPLQIDFDINVLGAHRPRLIFGNVRFADEEGTKTFGLYPQSEGAGVFAYEHNRLYHITLKAMPDKTELHIDGVKICDGPKLEEEIRLLQFRGGDWNSKGKTEFHKIRISPLP